MVKLKYPTKFVGITQGYKTTHLAIDCGWNSSYGGKNCSIYASGDGVVTSTRDGRNNTMNKGDSGNYVTIKYSDGYETRACHLLKGSLKVKKGDKVIVNKYSGTVVIVWITLSLPCSNTSAQNKTSVDTEVS